MIEFTCNPFQSSSEIIDTKPSLANFKPVPKPLPSELPNHYRTVPTPEISIVPITPTLPIVGNYYHPHKPEERSMTWLWLIVFILLGGFIYVVYKNEIDSFFKKLRSYFDL